jgi:hypothetical protein
MRSDLRTEFLTQILNQEIPLSKRGKLLLKQEPSVHEEMQP